ncbi:MAG: CAP domain-containing protein [Pyrinomonadaceae bacterium]
MFKYCLKALFVFIILSAFSAQAIVGQKSRITRKTPKTKTSPVKSEPVQPEPFRPTAVQQGILDEINGIRTDSRNYITFLEGLRDGMKEKVVFFPDGKMLLSQEGAPAYNDAISFLRTAPKLEPFKISAGLSKVADLQLTDLKENIQLSHYGKDGSDLEQRLFKIGAPGPEQAENISYFSETPNNIILSMILDEGLPRRPHRLNLFSSKFKEIGIAYGISKDGVALCVIVFNDKFIEKTGKTGSVRVM